MATSITAPETIRAGFYCRTSLADRGSRSCLQIAPDNRGSESNRPRVARADIGTYIRKGGVCEAFTRRDRVRGACSRRDDLRVMNGVDCLAEYNA